MARRVHIVSLLVAVVCASLATPGRADAGTHLTLSGPAQLGPISPDATGRFAFPNVPLRRNSVNVFTVTATDDDGQKVSRDVSITQLSLESVVVSKITAQPLSVQEVQQLVNEGVIALDNPENFNVSKFDIVLTIGQEVVPISVPIAMPKEKEETGYEIYRLPREDGNGGGGKPRPRPIDIIVFQEFVAGPPEVPIPPVPGVLIIEGRIKTLKEFFSVRLLLMNASGIFTLSDVQAQISFPQGGLSSTLPADGLVTFGNILPGSGDQPGQLEREFIIRGDEIGVRPVKVEFGGSVTGPGIPEDTPVPFNGSAQTTVEVKGPPSFQVQVKHPPAVVTDVPYELTVDILNTGETPALYASLELDVGADGELVNCSVDDMGLPLCEPIVGSAVRNLGHIFPGQRASQTFTINPLRTGVISSCMGVADQNIALQVYVGAIGCIVGRYPPASAAPDGIPTVNVLPPANALGIGIDSPVTAFFSETMNLTTITTGVNGSFRVHDGAGAVVPGQLRFETINEKTVAIWQVNDGITNRLAGNTHFSVFLTQDIRDLQGNALFAPWTSQFTTTSPTDDQMPPTLTLSIEPPVDPTQVLPGQVVRINAYAADQGTGVARIELRRKDVDVLDAAFELIDQKSQVDVLAGPVIFSVDSAMLMAGHTYQFKATAYDGPGNAQDATIAVIMAPSVTPPLIVLPDDPLQPVLQGISVNLTPVAVSGTVKTVHFFVDGAAEPFRTLTLPPFQTSLPTLTLALGDHSVRAVAIDGLGQTGEDTLSFTLATNASLPVVTFGSAVDGAQYVVGSTFPVAGSATDPVGLESVRFYLDAPGGAPIAVGTQPFTIDTTNLGEGPHQVIIVATNLLGVSNDPADAASILDFAVVPLPTGPPPPPPVLAPLTAPVNGHVSVQGTSVAGARIDITNLASGLMVGVSANGGGTFAATIDAAAGDTIRAVAYDFTQSQEPSTPVQVTVPAPPALDHIEVTPAAFTLTAPNAYRDLTVTGFYADGSTANLTSGGSFSSSNPSAAVVSASGRVVALASGAATIAVQVGDKQAQASVTVSIVTLVSISVEPSALLFTFVGQTATLAVTAHFSDGSAQPVIGGLAFGTGDPAVATVNAAGVVRAVTDGSTQVSVSITGVAPVIVPATVDTGQDEAPTVSIVSPADATPVERGDVVSVVVQASDVGGGVARVELAVTGATTFSEIRQITPPANAPTVTVGFSVSATAPVGGTITISVRAEDTAGQFSAAATRTLTVVDRTAPTVTIQAPAPHTPYNFGDTVTVQVPAADAVGVSRIRLEVSGAFSASPSQTIAPPTTAASATFEIPIPFGLTSPDVTLRAFARDAAGNEGASVPVPIEVTDADITPPETVVTAVAAPGTAASTVVTYEVLSGFDDLDHVELYFRRNGIGTFNRYTNAAAGNPNGEFLPQIGAIGTIVFDATRMGGDGVYEFFTVGVDVAGNREPAPQDSGVIVGDPGATATFAAGAEVVEIVTDAEIVGATLDDRNLRVRGATLTLVGPHRFRNVELLNGAVLTHRETTTTDEYGLDLEAWTVTVDVSSRLDVTGRGYLGGNRSGFGEVGATLGNLPGSPHGNGGSYGGLGGHYSGSGADQPNPVYGSLTNPAELGSGGGAWAGNGGDGGGRVVLAAINLVVDGAVRADGGVSAGSASGDGSGGALDVVARTLSGHGTLTANGGGNGSHTGGGGGRVAVRYLDLFTFSRERVTANGGMGYFGNGANGTVFFKQESEADGELILNGAGPGAPFTDVTLPPGQHFDAITLQNGARVVLTGAVELSGTLRVTGNSVLTHPTGSEAGLQITAARVVVDAGSAIDVSGRGYLGGNRAGFGERGATVGNQPGATHGNGGSHGGWGGHYSGAGADSTNPTYGDLWHPDKLGSGGGGWSGDGGNGGGYVRLVASEAVVVNGTLRADGGVSAGSASGDGSGGSVWITTSRLAGTGFITANGGGNGSHTGGGGGRVAVYADYVDATADLGALRNVTAWRGRGYYDNQPGSAGTVFIKLAGQSDGDLFVDDGMSGGTSPTGTPLPLVGPGLAQAVSADTLTVDGGVAITAGALVGGRLNPDVTQAETFAIAANTTGTIAVVTPNEHGTMFADVAVAGARYAGLYRFDNLVFRGGGHLEVGDRLEVSDTLQLAEFGLLTHPETTTAYEAELDLTVSTLAIDATSRIDVTGRGYLGGNRSGLGEVARTLGNAAGSLHGNGGSYGGLGGHYPGSGSDQPNPLYGSLTDPVELGSGGGAWSGAGGDGGGRVRVAADVVVLDGVIVADGAVSSGSASGDGSGGSVNLQVASLTGTGVVRANGGGNGSHTGGGGGRIAVRYASQMTLPVDHLQAHGGSGYYGNGGHGTVFVKGAAQGFGDLVIDGFGYVQPGDTTTIPGGLTFERVELRNGVHAVADSGITVTDTLRLAGNSTLTHSRANEFGLQITAPAVVVETGSAIDVTGRGYPGGNHSGFGESGATLGNVAGSGKGNGGSYGGLGGHYGGSGTNTPNPIYGDLTSPAELGSGGGAWAGAGGDGGGRVAIVAGTLVVDGTITADGGLSSGSASGDGSGGSINLQVGTLTGGGVIRANGGGVGGRTAGGGGRIAVHYQTAVDVAADNLEARGGTGYYGNGGHGTVFLQAASQAAGDLIVDGFGGVAPPDTTTIPGGMTFDSVILRNGVRALADDGIEVTGTLQLAGDTTLTHSRGHEPGLQIRAGAVLVGAGSAIDVSGRGYAGGNHSDFGESGATLGNVAGSKAGNGGSYGGLGGHYGGSGLNSPNPTYGSAAAPLELGSGGGAWAGFHGGDGGGRVAVVAENLTVEGTIAADANDSAGSAAGAGSGGGVYLQVGDLTGIGFIHANGGGQGSTTGGGGGRVAVLYSDAVDFPLDHLASGGGLGYYGTGQPGTVFIQGP